MFGIPGFWEWIILLLVGLLILLLVIRFMIFVLKAVVSKLDSLTSDDERIRHPECDEWIMAEAKKCRFCDVRLFEE